MGRREHLADLGDLVDRQAVDLVADAERHVLLEVLRDLALVAVLVVLVGRDALAAAQEGLPEVVFLSGHGRLPR